MGYVQWFIGAAIVAAALLPLAIRMRFRAIKRDRARLIRNRAGLSDAGFLESLRATPEQEEQCLSARVALAVSIGVPHEVVLPDDLLRQYARLIFDKPDTRNYAQWVCSALEKPLTEQTVKEAITAAGGRDATVRSFCLACAAVASASQT